MLAVGSIVREPFIYMSTFSSPALVVVVFAALLVFDVGGRRLCAGCSACVQHQ